MSMDDFNRALGITLQFEGGISDDAADPGGLTNRGVTQRTYDTYRSQRNLSHRSVRDINDLEVTAIYLRGYWQSCGCEAMAWPLNACVFDFAVNSGVARATRHLQELVGAKPDGIFGPDTAARVTERSPADLTQQLLGARRTYIAEIIAQSSPLAKFRAGWTNRIDRLQVLLLGPA